MVSQDSPTAEVFMLYTVREPPTTLIILLVGWSAATVVNYLKPHNPPLLLRPSSDPD